MKRIIKINDKYVLYSDCMKKQQNCRVCKTMTDFLSVADSWSVITSRDTIKYVVNDHALDANVFREKFVRACNACLFTTTARRLNRNIKLQPTPQRLFAMTEIEKQH